jgi:hypothetical protein
MGIKPASPVREFSTIASNLGVFPVKKLVLEGNSGLGRRPRRASGFT